MIRDLALMAGCRVGPVRKLLQVDRPSTAVDGTIDGVKTALNTIRFCGKDPAVSIRLVENFTAEAEGLRFQCDYNGKIIQCGIATRALRELIDFHQIKDTDDSVCHLVQEIERLVNAKCEAGRFEQNGWLVIWPVDLLRYGYDGRQKPAA
jgi:hypothetical protein